MSGFGRYLRDKIETVEKSTENHAVFLLAKDSACFRRLIIEQKRYGLIDFESCWEFTSLLDVVPMGEMDEKHKELFWKLKNYDCELEWKGLKIFARPYFRCSRGLDFLKRAIPEIEPDNRLAEELNGREDLMKLVRETKPEYIDLTLFLSIPQMKMAETQLFDVIRTNYYNPMETRWVTRVSKYIPKGLPLQIDRGVSNVFQILNIISETALDAWRHKGRC